MKNLVCLCIKYGTLYGAEYVNRLSAGLRRNSENRARLWCLTDDPRGIDPQIGTLPLAVEPFAKRMEEARLIAPKGGRLKKLACFVKV